jgi:hypothetical protein
MDPNVKRNLNPSTNPNQLQQTPQDIVWQNQLLYTYSDVGKLQTWYMRHLVGYWTASGGRSGIQMVFESGYDGHDPCCHVYINSVWDLLITPTQIMLFHPEMSIEVNNPVEFYKDIENFIIKVREKLKK